MLPSSNSLGCAAPAWLDNEVGPQGYGSGVAFPPARIMVESDAFLSYGSDGKTQLPLQITIMDQGNTVVTSGAFGLPVNTIICTCPVDCETNQKLGVCVCTSD